MHIKILWMYSDIMDLYGDKGNIAALKYRAEQRNVNCEIHKKGISDDIDFCEYDLVFIGGGADKEQRILSNDLLRHKESILKALKEGVFFLLICGGYQLFGKYYIDAKGNKIEGLNICNYYTEAGQDGTRCIGNVIVAPKTLEIDMPDIVVGFENHGGQTLDVDKPFAKVLYGQGNSFNSMQEGYYDGNILGTYIHGPLLPKNSKLTDFLIKKMLKRKYGNVELKELDDTFENEAVKVIVDRYMKDENLETNN